jgi:hypothetical protein
VQRYIKPHQGHKERKLQDAQKNGEEAGSPVFGVSLKDEEQCAVEC